MNQTKDIKAILFDYGGVLAEEGFSNTLEALAREQNLAVENMTAAGMQAVYDSGFVLGKGGESEFWSLLRERTGLRGEGSELRARMLDGFIIRPWMLELVAKLSSRGYVTGILSDQTDWLDRLDTRDHFYQFFDRIFNSYTMGKGKRDVSHFTDVAADLGLPPSTILFIDDSNRNVENARVVGMHAIRYVRRQEFIEALKASLGIDVL
jgi:putative hydrolase of the HAD superfamily